MRILFYIEHFKKIGGAENYAVSLCKELSHRGYELHIVCKDGDELDGIKLYGNFHDIKGILRKVKHDISFDWGLFERADISRLGGGIHRFFIDYALYSFPPYLRPIKWILYRLGKHKKKIRHQKYVLDSPFSLYIAPSLFIKRHAIEYGISDNRITVLYNGVDLKRFMPEDKSSRDKIRKKWGIKERDVVFLFVSHNLRLKNLRLLKKVFDELHKDFPMIKLMVVGKRKPGFRAPYLVYTGPVQDMPEIYALGDVLVHPSYFDTFGSVVIEAMASGLPVIVSRFAGASEIVEDGGIVLPVVGSEAMQLWRGSIKEMLDKELRADMGYKARLIAERYDFSSYVDRIEALIRSV